MDEENRRPVSWGDRPPGEEEEKVEESEDEDDFAPLPPEMIAASFETAKPQLVEDNDDALAPPELTASPFEGHGDEEDERDETEDEDCAPLPPEMIAASFETAKPKLIEDYDDSSASPDQVASPYDGYGYEEGKVEETEDEDDCAPLPPEMIAASFEEVKPKLIEDYDDASFPPRKISSPYGGYGDEDEDEDCAPLPPEMIAASFEAAKPKLIEDYDDASFPPRKIALPYEEYGDEDENEDCAPLPPEMIAASFEAAKPKLIEDYDDVSIPPASLYEVFGNDEDKFEKTEDDFSPLPPQMIAASYEVVKPKSIEDYDDLSNPPEKIATPYEGYGDEEEKVEEAEDEDYAPLPPGMIAASFEPVKPKWIEDDDGGSVSRNRIAAPFEADCNDAERRVEVDDKVAPALLEKATMPTKAVHVKSISKGDGPLFSGPDVMYASIQGYNHALENREDLENNYGTDFIPDVTDKHKTTVTAESRKKDPDNSYDDYAASSSRPSQSGNDLSLYYSDQRRSDDFGLYLNPNMMSESHPGIDPSLQSLPLLEARLFYDLPEEEVYDAFPIDSTPDKDSHGWSTQARKYRFVISGLVLSAAAATIAVAVVVSSDKKNDITGPNSLTETVLTSTTSTIIPLNASAPPPCHPDCLWKKQDDAILGTAAGDTLGWAVALSADEMTLVVGAPGYINDDKKEGYVEVYNRDNVTELIQTIHGDKIGDLFGHSVDIAANGTILAIGSPGNWKKADRPGYVRIYHRENSYDLGLTWKPLGQDITGEKLGAEFGRYVSLSDDGKTLAVVLERNMGKDGQEGLVRIYHRGDDSTSWERIGQDIDGEELSLSGDGKIVAIGAPWNNEVGHNRGCVKVYNFVSDTSLWEPMGDALYGDTNGDNFGWFVELSTDGTILATGSAGYQSYDRVGFVRVYHLENSDDGFSWKKHGQDITGEVLGDEFGSSGFLSSDGNTVAVAAFSVDGGSHVGVYRMNNTSLKWTQQGEDIMDDIADDYSRNTALSLSEDGKTVVIGTFGNNGNGTSPNSDFGLVRIFTNE